MRRPVLVLALLAAAPLVAAIGGTGFPDDELIVRDCYGGADDDLNAQLNNQLGLGTSGAGYGGGGSGMVSRGKGSGGAKGSAKSAPSQLGGASNVAATPPPPPEAAAPAPADEAASVTKTTVTKHALSKVPQGRSYESTVDGPSGSISSGIPTAEPTQADARKQAEESARKRAESEARRKAEESSRESADAVASAESARRAAEDQARRAAEAAERARLEAERAAAMAAEAERKESIAQRVRSALDWGATIYLSNDDSMSLASAQRVIYALQRGMRVPTDHIRPHELLNYFSFDVAEPSTEQLFDVHASAIQDGDQLSVALAVKGATPEPDPLDLTVIVDRSGSMASEGQMAYTQRGLHRMTERLKRGDRLDLVLFDNQVCTPIQNFVVGRDDPAILEREISRIQPNGGTNLDQGLKEGYAVATGHVDTRGRNRRVMLITDAVMNQGDVNPHTVTEIAKAFEDHDIRLTGIGVGRDFRDDVLDRLTEKGKGAYVFLGSEGVVDRVFGTGFPSLVQTIAHDVQFQLDLPENLAMERFYGEEASTVAADIQPIHYYAGTSQVFLQDLAVKPGRLDTTQPVTLTVRYREADTGEPAKRVFRTTLGQMLDSDSHNVTKAKALMAWTDMLQSESMGGDPCGDNLRRYAGLATELRDDAEIAFVNDLVMDRCGELPLPTTVAAAPLKVRIDSDQPISAVALACPGQSEVSEALSGSDTIARFSATAGTCTMTLAGLVDLRVEVDVPETGRDLRCTVRGGRVHCG